MKNNQIDDRVLLANEFGEIKKITLANTISAIEIKHQQCAAKISLYGGQVLTWQPTNQQPVFWLSKDALYQKGKAIRGGIPLCWPWFGPYNREGKKAGNHGFARINTWLLDKTEISKKGVVITLILQGDNQHDLSENNVWPHAFCLTQTLFFGKTFKQKLTIKNNTDKSIGYSAALHSYFSVSAPENIRVPTLTSVAFDDKLTAEHDQILESVQCVGPVDRIYHSCDVMQIIDQEWNRIINIDTENTQQWVLWNPGKEGAEQMSDIHRYGENEYLCLEAANTKWQTILANSEVNMSQEITVTKV